MLQVEKIFMETFCSHTCASIAGRGIKKAYDYMRKYMSDTVESTYCLKLDIRKYYPNIGHVKLKELLRRKFKDKDLLELFDMLIDSYPTDKGVPIGSYLSQFLANFYLMPFDHWLKEEKHVKRAIRYMDDIVILHGSKEYLHKLRREIDDYLYEVLGLELKHNWQVFPVAKRGVDFVGYRFFPDFILLRKKILIRMRRLVRKIVRKQRFVELLTFREWCSANSYVGWLTWCNSYRLFEKYVEPITPSLLLYYGKEILILGEKLTARRWITRFKKYTQKLFQKRGLKHDTLNFARFHLSP